MKRNIEQLNNLFKFLEQGNNKYTYVRQETLHFEICKRKAKTNL